MAPHKPTPVLPEHASQYEVRSIRKALGLTQKEFADRVGVSEFTVFRWESAARRPSRKKTQAIRALRTDAMPAKAY